MLTFGYTEPLKEIFVGSHGRVYLSFIAVFLLSGVFIVIARDTFSMQ
jgi:hypothetical protein